MDDIKNVYIGALYAGEAIDKIKAAAFDCLCAGNHEACSDGILIFA